MKKLFLSLTLITLSIFTYVQFSPKIQALTIEFDENGNLPGKNEMATSLFNEIDNWARANPSYPFTDDPLKDNYVIWNDPKIQATVRTAIDSMLAEWGDQPNVLNPPKFPDDINIITDTLIKNILLNLKDQCRSSCQTRYNNTWNSQYPNYNKVNSCTETHHPATKDIDEYWTCSCKYPNKSVMGRCSQNLDLLIQSCQTHQCSTTTGSQVDLPDLEIAPYDVRLGKPTGETALEKAFLNTQTFAEGILEQIANSIQFSDDNAWQALNVDLLKFDVTKINSDLLSQIVPNRDGGYLEYNRTPSDSNLGYKTAGYSNLYGSFGTKISTIGSSGSCNCSTYANSISELDSAEKTAAFLRTIGTAYNDSYFDSTTGKPKIYARRAAYPGWYTGSGHRSGGLCGMSLNLNGQLVSEKDFWIYQARMFYNNYGISTCDPDSNIIYQRVTSAQCDRKKSSSPKCRSGSRTYSSIACDAFGGTVNQCGNMSSGYNVACQICAPIYCSDQSPKLYSDNATSAKFVQNTGVPDLTCPTGQIPDPCTKVELPNNWNGSRICYRSCCSDANNNNQCDYIDGGGSCNGTSSCFAQNTINQFCNDAYADSNYPHRIRYGVPATDPNRNKYPVIYNDNFKRSIAVNSNDYCYYCDCQDLGLKSGWYNVQTDPTNTNALSSKCSRSVDTKTLSVPTNHPTTSCSRCTCVNGDGICDKNCNSIPQKTVTNVDGIPFTPDGQSDSDCCGLKDGYCPISCPEDPDCGACPSNYRTDGICSDNCPDDPDCRCPDGFGQYCEGKKYYSGVEGSNPPGYYYPGRDTCKTCGTDGPEEDGYCDPLYQSSDPDCWPPNKTGCPLGFGETKSNPSCIGDTHPLYPSCNACQSACSTDQVECSYDVDNDGVYDFEPILKAEQILLYQLLGCYGYQMKTQTISSNTGGSSAYYDPVQEQAWFGNGTYDSDTSTGGYRRCRPPRKPTAQAVSSCEFVCIPKKEDQRILPCSEIDPRFPHEFGIDQPISWPYLFIPDTARSSGQNNARCGRYYYPSDGENNSGGIAGTIDADTRTSYLFTDWWQVKNSNAYGNQGLANYQEQSYTVRDPNDCSDSQGTCLNPATASYVRKSAQYSLSTNGTSPNYQSGLQISGNRSDNGSAYPITGTDRSSSANNPNKMSAFRTYRPDNKTNIAAEGGYNPNPLSVAYNTTMIYDFRYYRSLIDYASLASCGSSFTNIDNSQVCKFSGNVTAANLKGILPNNGNQISGKYVIFIEGNFTLNGLGNANAITLANDGYLSLIISGTFTIESSVGNDSNPLSSCQNQLSALENSGAPSLEAVLIADKLDMKHDTTVVDSLFNPGRSGNVGIFCDRKLILGGSYSFWGDGDVTFTRSLRGCVLKDTTNGHTNGTDTIGIHRASGTSQLPLNSLGDQYCRQNGLYLNVNQQQPAVTITYDSRFSVNTPNWMKENRIIRTEVQ